MQPSSLPAHSPAHGPSGSPEPLLYDPESNVRALDQASAVRDVLGALWQGKWLALSVFVAVLGAAASYVYSIPSEYETQALLLVKPGSQSRSLSSLGIGSMGMYNSGSLANELFVLARSEELKKRVAERLIEAERVPSTGEPLSILYTRDGRRLNVDQVASRVGSYTRSGLFSEEISGIAITGISTVPGEAAFVANVLAEEYVEHARATSRQEITAMRTFIEGLQDTLLLRLDRQEEAVLAFMNREGALNLNQEAQRAVSEVASLESRLVMARIDLETQRASLDRQIEELASVDTQLVDLAVSSIDAELRQAQEQKTQLRLQLERTLEAYPELENANVSPDRLNEAERRLLPQVRQMEERIASQEQRIATLAERYIQESLGANAIDPTSGGLSTVASQRQAIAERHIEISGQRARIAAMESQLADYEEEMRTIPAQSLELARLQRPRQMTEQLLTSIAQRLQEIRITEQSETGYAEIVSPARISWMPVRPEKENTMRLAALLGLVLGAGLVLLRQRLDTLIHQPNDLLAQGHSLIGVVPSMRKLIDSDFDGAEHVTIDGRRVNTTLAMLISPMSAPAEAYRRVRTNLRFSRPDTPLHTIVVTSADKGEGKTTTSVNLALAMASGGRRTLLIDSDLRRPRVHRTLDVAREPGLSQLLFGKGPLDLDRFKTDVDNLHLIPAGASVPNPAELLGSQRMMDLLDDLREAFDFIIVDTPPVLTFSDALPVATHSDGVVLVAMADHSDKRAHDHAANMLREVGATTLGSILNRFDPESSAYGYSYSYGYGYNYGYVYSYQRMEDYYGGDDERSASGLLR
jgi:capsular exopolysaccharide synthesis family protein